MALWTRFPGNDRTRNNGRGVFCVIRAGVILPELVLYETARGHTPGNKTVENSNFKTYIFIAGDMTAMSVVHMAYEPEKGLEGTVVTSVKVRYRRLYGGGVLKKIAKGLSQDSMLKVVPPRMGLV
jgi:hypothetical protein